MDHIVNENYKIYLITMDRNDQFWMVMDNGAGENGCYVRCYI